MDFTFTTEDCIDLRRQVLICYRDMCGSPINIPNVVKASAPWEDVVSDFQMIIYCYLFKEGMREVERAYAVNLSSGIPVIRKEAKQQYTRVQKIAQSIGRNIPFGNTNFVCQYADIDEALSERIEQLVQHTYYPLLNNALKECPGLNSEVAQAVAHMVAGMCFVIMACERGMIRNHRVPSESCRIIGDNICRLAAITTQVNHTAIDFDSKQMEKTFTDTMNVVINSAEQTMVAIIERAKSLNLTAYINAADQTKEDFEREVKAQRKQLKHAFLKTLR